MLQVRAKAQPLAMEQGVDLLVVDYLQLVSGSRRYENRPQEVTEISRSLKNFAKGLDVPVITVSQLNREVEKRSGGRKPQLSDIRASGAVEQDSDLVLFISREGTDDDFGVGDCTAEISIGKHAFPVNTLSPIDPLSRFGENDPRVAAWNMSQRSRSEGCIGSRGATRAQRGWRGALRR